MNGPSIIYIANLVFDLFRLSLDTRRVFDEDIVALDVDERVLEMVGMVREHINSKNSSNMYLCQVSRMLLIVVLVHQVGLDRWRKDNESKAGKGNIPPSRTAANQRPRVSPTTS